MAHPSPIHDLPYELVTEIMVLVVTTPYTTKWGSKLSHGSAADVLVLCQVCSYWRQVAFNIPQLWLVETLPITNGKDVASFKTEMFLERSAPLPISVQIYPALHMCKHMPLPPVIIDAARRWKSLEMIYNIRNLGEFDSSALARIPAGSLENLEKLVLKWSKLEVWQGPELDIFLSAPRLREVTIEAPHMTPDLIPFQWAQLTHLSVTYDSPQSCLDILVQCTNLVSCHFVANQWLESDSPDAAPLGGTGLLPHLEELNIEIRICSTGEHLGPFLRRLRLPALKSLSLSLSIANVEDYSVSWATPPLIFLLTRSPNVECLKLNFVVFTEDMQDILQLTPNLVELVLADTEVDDDFFTTLRYSETGGSSLVPKLQTLELRHVGEDFTVARFAEMIRSRWWSDEERLAMPNPPRVARLKCLRFWSEDVEDGVDTPFLEEMTNAMEFMRFSRFQGLDLKYCNYF